MIDAINHTLQRDWSSDFTDKTIEWVLFTNGGAFAHDNVILFGIPVGSKDPLFVAKVCRSPLHSQTLQVEYDNLKLLHSLPDDNVHSLLPQPIALVTSGHDKALITNFIAGDSLLISAKKALNNDTEFLVNWMTLALRTMNKIHQHACRTVSPSINDSDDFGQKFSLFRSLFSLSRTEEDALKQLFEVVESNNSAPTRTLIQGDFWYGNVIKRHVTDSLAIIDWQFSRQSHDVSLDVYLYLLTAALTASGANTPNEQKRTIEVLKSWQSSLMVEYLQDYECPNGLHLLPPYEGMLICCIEMATRPTFVFGKRHPDDEMWRALFGELVKQFIT